MLRVFSLKLNFEFEGIPFYSLSQELEMFFRVYSLMALVVLLKTLELGDNDAALFPGSVGTAEDS